MTGWQPLNSCIAAAFRVPFRQIEAGLSILKEGKSHEPFRDRGAQAASHRQRHALRGTGEHTPRVRQALDRIGGAALPEHRGADGRSRTQEKEIAVERRDGNHDAPLQRATSDGGSLKINPRRALILLLTGYSRAASL